MMSDTDSKDEIKIPYTRPRYTSKTAPDLPQELIDRIATLLYNDVASLFSCLRTCRAWYHAARRHLQQFIFYDVYNRGSLDRISRVLAAKKTRRFYGDKLLYLHVREDRIRPFAHTFPFRIPGVHLPKVTHLQVTGVDWEKRRPHSKFFMHISGFAAVTQLELMGCRFYSSHGLFALVKSLRCLKFLTLQGIVIKRLTLQTPVTHPNLRQLRIRQLTADIACAVVSTLCYMSPPDGLAELEIEADCFTSLKDFASIIRSIPTRVNVVLRIEGSKRWNPRQETTGALSPLLAPFALWIGLRIHILWERDGVYSNVYEILSIAPSDLQSLEIQESALWPPPQQALSLLQGHMQRLGPSLKAFTWMLDGEVYLPSLAFCTVLESLTVQFWGISDEDEVMHKTCNLIAAVLSQITSPRLTRFEFELTIRSISGGYNSRETKIPTPTSLQDILSRDVFKDLPDKAVKISISWHYSIDSAVMKTIADVAHNVLPPLLTPWLQRGVLELQLPDRDDAYKT